MTLTPRVAASNIMSWEEALDRAAHVAQLHPNQKVFIEDAEGRTIRVYPDGTWHILSWMEKAWRRVCLSVGIWP